MVRNKARESNNMISVEKSTGRGFNSHSRLQLLLNQSFARARWAGNPPHCDHIQAVRPGMEVFKVSAKTGQGMDAYLEFLESRRARSRAAAAF
jgi:hypothetical protein